MDVISLRRDLHQHPEVGFTEFRTASIVVETLQSFGFQVSYGADAIDAETRGGVPSEKEIQQAYQRALDAGANPDIIKAMEGGLTAVVGILKGNRPGPTIAFRFDMDALPIEESMDSDHIPQVEGFRAKYDGIMHACAHDGHTAIGLGLAEKMSHGDFAGTLKLIFQPAEEGGRGGFAMMTKGVVDDVDQIFCLHLGLDVPFGEIAAGSTGWLCSKKFSVQYHGVPSHAGGAPEKGRNALVGAATALLNIHALPRHSSCETRLNVGVLEGGTTPNIIPHFAKMLIEARSSSDQVLKDLEKRVLNIISHSAEMHELQYDVEIIGESRTIHCDDELIVKVLEEAQQTEGFTSFKERINSGVGEDASWLIHRVQENGGKGTYMMIGTEISAPHHHQKFDINEKILPMSVKLLENVANRVLVGSEFQVITK